MKPNRSRRMTRLLAFGPAVVMVCLTAFVASGASIVSGASATAVDITGEVAGSASVDATPTIGGGANGCADEDLDSFETGFDSTNGCRITFAANYAGGAQVEFSDALYSAAPDTFFCSDGDETGGVGTRDCSIEGNRVENVPADRSQISDDTVGIALVDVAGGDGGTDAEEGSSMAAEDAAPAAVDSIWSPITNTAGQLCFTDVPNGGAGEEATCNFVVGADGQAGAGAGDYSGQVLLTTTPD